MVTSSLILQRSSNKYKTSEIQSHVERRLNLWQNKNVEDLLNETITIQKRLPQQQKPQTTEQKPKRFAKLVLEGKIKATIWLLDGNTSSGGLLVSADAIKTLRQKHLDAKPLNHTMMLYGLLNDVNEVIFDRVNTDLVRKCAIRTRGLH